ncbi:hypothetical protein C0989_002032, partial [Termitomyces sp. Mn162]
MCKDKKNKKVYQSFHVKFIEQNESCTTAKHHQPPPNNSKNAPPILTFQDLEDTATLELSKKNNDLSELDVKILDPNMTLGAHQDDNCDEEGVQQPPELR